MVIETVANFGDSVLKPGGSTYVTYIVGLVTGNVSNSF